MTNSNKPINPTQNVKYSSNGKNDNFSYINVMKTTFSNWKLIKVFIFIVISASMTSCYVDGGVGPQGPPGEGLNRFVTYNYNIRAVDWVQQVNDINTYLYQKTNLDITSGVINNGMVLVYARFDGKPWVQLPMTNHFTDEGIPYTIEYLPFHTVGAFEIQYIDSHPQPLAPKMFTELRVVIVEGTNYMNAIKNKNKNNYDDIITALNQVNQNQNIEK